MTRHQTDPAPFWQSLENNGDAIALINGANELSYLDLAALADEFTSQTLNKLPDAVVRPLLLIEASNCVDAIAAYLGAVRAGWPIILAEQSAPEKTAQLQAAFRPNVIVRNTPDGMQVDVTDAAPVDMAPELAVMLSTSGTTGSQKLVRLSKQNIASNACAIVDYIGLTQQDCAITTLPWHYSFGMSVLNAQLAAGGKLTLCDHSLTERDFWCAAQASGTTVLPLVPMQFEILARKKQLKSELPSLQYLLQAGGKLDRELAEDFSQRSKSEGFELFLMYGQTEASPRMSYLPPSAPMSALDTIGQAIPGGQLRVVDDHGDEVTATGVAGELVFNGPNVMMGYAQAPEDLAQTGHLTELRTGDIAEKTDDGFFKIVGRAKRFIKLNGLRISLDQVETNLRDAGISARVTGTDQRLDVFLTDKDALIGLKDRLCRDLKLSHKQVSTQCISQFPQLSSGKLDYRALSRRADELAQQRPAGTDELQSVFTAVLRTADLDLNASFRDHGGDSLGYLEIELALNKLGAEVPDNWDDLPLSALLDLKPTSKPPKAIRQTVSIDLIWRVAAITAVVAAHSTSWNVIGGAYFLLVLSGYSLARFQAPTLMAGHVGRSVANSLFRILVWYYLIVLLVQAMTGPVPLNWWALVGNIYHEGPFHKIHWYWYVSAMVQITLVISVPFLIKPVASWIARNPFAYGLGLLFSSILFIGFLQSQMGLIWDQWRHSAGAIQLASIGWCAYYAERPGERLATVAAVLATLLLQWGVGDPMIQAFIAFGSISLAYGLQFKLPAVIARVLAYAGAMTLPIYMLHVFAIAVVQRVGIAYADPNWPNWLLFASTVVLSVAAAAVALPLERQVIGFVSFAKDRRVVSTSADRAEKLTS